MTEIVKDTSWLRASFLAATKHPSDRHRYRMSNGWMKFMDTTLGGNTAVNAPYQFCRYADIKERRLMPDVGKGMGRWYSENIDDWGHDVHFRMGTPAHTGILNYALKSINGPAARYVATGRTPGISSLLGKVAGFIVSAAFWEITLLTMFINNFMDALHSRFYYIKPNMSAYWGTVQTILNSLSANLGLTLSAKRGTEGSGDSKSATLDVDDDIMGGADGDLSLLQRAKQALPDTFRSPAISNVGNDADIGVDAFAVASRAQHLSIKYKKRVTEMMSELSKENLTIEGLARKMEDVMMGSVNVPGNKGGLKGNYSTPTLKSYIDKYSRNPAYSQSVTESQTGLDISEVVVGAVNAADKQAKSDSVTGWFEQTVDSMSSIFSDKGTRDAMDEMLLAELQDGFQWCSFRVTNAVNSVSESFSNSSQESELSQIFNNMSQTARTAMFNLGGGKTGIRLIDEGIGAVTGAIGDFLTEAAAGSFNFFNPIIGMMYGAQIEIPKRWASSSTSMPSSNFSIELRAGYGNVISYYQDILFPLAMLLAMALPRGTGQQSFGSPFYVQYYSKGRSQVSIGLVSSLSITRGVGNAPWHKRGWPMGVNVEMTIEDMSSVIFSPVSSYLESSSLANARFASPIDENAMGDYMAVLSALGLNEQEYLLPRLKRRYNRLVNDFNSWLSPWRWTTYAVDTVPGQLLSKFNAATDVRF